MRTNLHATSGALALALIVSAAAWASAGTVAGASLGEERADRILAGAALSAGIGAGAGTSMDQQEEKLAHIPGTTVERAGPHVLLVRLSSDALFDADSAVLRPGAEQTLYRVASVLIQDRRTAIVVQGFTDSNGSDEHDLALSRRRADALRDYFVGQGIDPDRMVAVGYGEGHPIASNETPEGRRLNRRVTILLEAKAP